jgi:hypothetical protein
MLYTISLYIHIVGALVLFSAVGIEWLCLTSIRKAETREAVRSWLGNFLILKKFFGIAFLLLLISGIYMMADIWRTAAFAVYGIIGLLVLSVSGRFLSGKKMAAIGAAAFQNESEFPLSDLLLKVRDKSLWESFLIRTFTAFGLVFLMTFKTNFFDSTIVIVIAILIGYLFGKVSKSPQVLQKA